MAVTASAELPGIGKAARCQISRQWGPHRPARFIWHHILPEACGGKTEPGNLAQLCDNCHMLVHELLWHLANGGTPSQPGSIRQQALAQQGYQAALAAGTERHIPKEA